MPCEKFSPKKLFAETRHSLNRCDYTGGLPVGAHRGTEALIEMLSEMLAVGIDRHLASLIGNLMDFGSCTTLTPNVASGHISLSLTIRQSFSLWLDSHSHFVSEGERERELKINGVNSATVLLANGERRNIKRALNQVHCLSGERNGN